MSSMFKYDPLDILDRAQKSADDSWNNTLNFAKKRSDLDQQAMENAFKNDKQFNTYGSEIFKANNQNESAGLRAANESFVYGRALTPENQNARGVSIDNAYQSPAAKLAGDAAGAQFADVEQRNLAALDASKQFSGALGAQAVYGQGATNSNSSNVASDISAGMFPSANERLRSMGIDLQIAPGPTAGTVVMTGPDGRPSKPMNEMEAARIIQDRTGVRPGQAQVYSEQAQAGQDKFANQMALNDAKMAQKDRWRASKMQTEEGKLLFKELELAQKSGDAARLSDAQMRLTDFRNRTDAEFERTYTPNQTYTPTQQGPRPASAADIVNGPKVAPAPAAPAQPQAPAVAKVDKKDDAVYKPKVTTQESKAEVDPTEKIGLELDNAKSQRSQIQAKLRTFGTMQRAKNPQEFERLMQELDKAKLTEDEMQRKYERMINSTMGAYTAHQRKA